MNNKLWLANTLMILAAAIWGFAFVAQRVGMETMGPHLFNSLRFFIGGFMLLPVIYLIARFNNEKQADSDAINNPTNQPTNTQGWPNRIGIYTAGIAAGVFLFVGITFQQMGLQYTTAGKAGFITSLYIFFVPMIGLLWGMQTSKGMWIGAILAVVGLYLLSIRENLTLSYGDTLMLICAFAFALHVLIIGYLASRFDTIKLSVIQFFTAAIMALLVAILTEHITWASIVATLVPLAYAGVMSTGVAYTFQVVAQQHAHSSHAAIILSSEGVFAVIGGTWLLNESLPAAGFIGCALILAGMLLSQLWPQSKT